MRELPTGSVLQLASRRRALAMSISALAVRSGVPVATVKRILGGKLNEASVGNVAAVASALGTPLGFADSSIEEFRCRQARTKAERIARLVQGTSALESQAVDCKTYESLVARSYHELLAGSPRRLWSA